MERITNFTNYDKFKNGYIACYNEYNQLLFISRQKGKILNDKVYRYNNLLCIES